MLNRLFKLFSLSNGIIVCQLILLCILVSCHAKKDEQAEEQIRTTSSSSNGMDSVVNSIKGNVSLNQIPTLPNSVLLTGLTDHRLVTVYKSRVDENLKKWNKQYDGNESSGREHFMPGMDILYGYNLLNIGHYDLKSEKLNFLFDHPALIKTLYYPSFVQDSLDKKPINRNYYLISVYDKDTNKDTLINRYDLRRFYLFDASASVKTQLIPDDYSALRSQYDSKNDVMYIFAIQDTNKNGTGEINEPIHIFWMSLKNPGVAKRLY